LVVCGYPSLHEDTVALVFENASTSAVKTSSAAVGPEPVSADAAAVQSVGSLGGSWSCAPAYAGPPVHWFLSTTRRRCVAFTGLDNVNERMIRFGATGRGARPGKASPGLVYTVVKPRPPAQFETVASHASTWKLRSALK